jgi:transcriptional regulator with XRE-family HTH domain
MTEDIKVKLSKRIRQLRQKYGYSQQQLCELADLEYKHIQRLESKRPCDVKLTTLEKLAKAFKMPLAKLLDF